MQIKISDNLKDGYWSEGRPTKSIKNITSAMAASFLT